MYYARVNSVLYDFRNVPCHVEAKLLSTFWFDLLVYGRNYGTLVVLMFSLSL